MHMNLIKFIYLLITKKFSYFSKANLNYIIDHDKLNEKNKRDFFWFCKILP